MRRLTNEELLRGVRTAWDKGWMQVKLYFMIGGWVEACSAIVCFCPQKGLEAVQAGLYFLIKGVGGWS